MTVYVQLVNVNGLIADVDDEAILGPFKDGIQLTYNALRETWSGDDIAYLRNGRWYTVDGRGPFSDVTFSETWPESVLPVEPQ